MAIPAAYLGVILIWTTTPLAIKWSAEAGFFFGLTARMAIGALVGLSLLVLLLATWGLLGLSLPLQIPPRAAWSILYLGVVGSVFGFALYFFVLRYLPATRVALITLVTPVSALLLGHLLNQESLGSRIWLGTGAILLGLLFCQSRRRPV